MTPSRNVDTESDEPMTDRRYLLHLRHSHGTTRRVTLRDVADGRVHTFDGLAEMLRFLEVHGTDEQVYVAEASPWAQDTEEGER